MTKMTYKSLICAHLASEDPKDLSPAPPLQPNSQHPHPFSTTVVGYIQNKNNIYTVHHRIKSY